MRRLEHETRVTFPGEEFSRLQQIKTSGGPLLPQDVEIMSVELVITGRSVVLHVGFFSRNKKSGSEDPADGSPDVQR